MQFKGTCMPAAGLEDWRSQALCAQTDPEAFYPEKGESAREALAVCRRCEVAAPCLAEALAADERFGVWGGTTERERRRLRRAQRAAVLAESEGPASVEASQVPAGGAAA